MGFEYKGITVRYVNPEALPIAQNNLAKLIIKLAKDKIAKDQNDLKESS